MNIKKQGINWYINLGNQGKVSYTKFLAKFSDMSKEELSSASLYFLPMDEWGRQQRLKGAENLSRIFEVAYK